MGFCYLMSRERAEQVAAAMQRKYTKMAATIDAGPVDPMPTEHDREESRMP